MAHDAWDPFLDREPAKHAIFSMHPQEYAIHRTSGWRCHATPATIMDGNPCHGAPRLGSSSSCSGCHVAALFSAGYGILGTLRPGKKRRLCDLGRLIPSQRARLLPPEAAPILDTVCIYMHRGWSIFDFRWFDTARDLIPPFAQRGE